MLRITIIIQLLFFNLSLLASSNEEFRSTWVITWEHINPDDTPEENMARVRAILDDHSSANMNAVLFQARQSGTAYYNSSYEPWGYYAGYEDPGYDPLAYAIEQAHARGLELHAWFNVFASASLHEGAPAAEHPEWICRDRSGNPMTENIALSPGLDSVREYLVSVAMEIIRNYDIDGLHLDYIRWNEYTNSTRSSDYAKWVRETRALDGMITQEQIEELSENPEGRYLYDIEHPYNGGIPDSAGGGQFPSWEDWWRWGVTEFVHVLHDSIQAVKPWIR
ncbi:MAG: glycoside hydrolase family 10 protein, partial [Fidelibacterota bacterium]